MKKVAIRSDKKRNEEATPLVKIISPGGRSVFLGTCKSKINRATVACKAQLLPYISAWFSSQHRAENAPKDASEASFAPRGRGRELGRPLELDVGPIWHFGFFFCLLFSPSGKLRGQVLLTESLKQALSTERDGQGGTFQRGPGAKKIKKNKQIFSQKR